jgi:hypothetical protein
VVCFAIISRASFLASLPMFPSVLIHSEMSVGLFGGFGIVVCG